MHHRTMCRRGVSRVDVLIAIVVGALALQLALPALPAAREAARRHQCQAHLRQLGIALHSYHDRFQMFPPAATWGSEGLDLSTLDTHEFPTPVHVTRRNWIQFLLPDLDQAGLAGQFDDTVPAADERNRVARTTLMPSLGCPSDPYNRGDNFYRMPLPDGSHVEFARGNYAINGGSEYVPMHFGTLANPDPTHSKYTYNEETREFRFSGNGIAGINECRSLREFRNGQSTLVALEEVRAGLSPLDTRGAWALGQTGASITWGHGVSNDCSGPNANAPDGGADDVLRGPELVKQLGKELIEAERMQICTHCDENEQATSRSKHAGGVYVLMLDGAAHFVSDDVESALWHVLHSRETPPGIFGAGHADELDGPPAEPKGAKGEGPKGERATEEAKVSPRAALPGAVENSLGMQFVRIPAGKFQMGVPDAGYSGPYPPDAIPHPVRITRDYLLGRHEITQRQFEEILRCNPSAHSATGEFQERVGAADTRDWPADNVSWDDAVEFCRRLSSLPAERAAGRRYRLPTEAEWEYASRAGRSGPIDRPEWKADDPTGEIGSKKVPKEVVLLPSPVGSFPANPFGVHDLCGNVYEWTADYRRRDYYAQSPIDDPQGPATGYLRVIRGWHWVAKGPACKVYVANEPWTGSPFIGFRVVCAMVDGSAEFGRGSSE